jgi:hypothetical protein
VSLIRELSREIISLSGTEENRRKQRLQEGFLAGDRNSRPLVFARTLRPYLAQQRGIALDRALTDSEVFLEVELLNKRAEALDFDDDTWICPVIDIWLGVVFEPSLMGVPWHPKVDTQAWFGDPPLSDIRDVDKLDRVVEDFDWRSTGMMGLAHEHYRLAVDRLGEGYSVIFPRWFCGNMRMAQKLRGDNNLFMDFYDDPDRLKRMMAIVTRMRRKFDALYTEAFPRLPPGDHTFSSYMKAGFILGDDEVDGNIISPQTYEEFIYPSDREFCAEHRGIYFHSCGNLTPMLPLIRTLPNLRILHVSSLTDFPKAVEVFGDSVIYEKTISDWDRHFAGLLSGDTAEVEEMIRLAKERGVFVYFMTDVEKGDPHSVRDTQTWVSALKELIRRHYPG